MERKEWRCDGAYLKYDELCGPLLFIPPRLKYTPAFSNKPLWQSHADPPNTHTPCHLDMNGRLTFRAVSTLRSSFIQISLLPPPCLIRCQQFFTDIISGCKWIWTGVGGWLVGRGGGGGGSGGGGVGGVVMDKIPHWLQNAACGEMGILNTPPPEPSPNSILQKREREKKITFLFQKYWLWNTTK